MKGLLAALLLLVVTAGGASAAAGLTPELAFSAQGDIWVANADGSGLVRFEAAGDDTSPVWSPDGSRIAFTAMADGVSRLTVINADGTGRLTLDVGAASSPTWSRDGRRIAFVRPVAGGGAAEVRVADASAVGSTPVTPIQPFDAPAWTADGRLVVAVPTSGANAVLRSIDPDTRQSIRIDDGGWPTVSPDGSSVAYVATTRPPAPTLYVATVDGAGARRVTTRRTALSRPSWSPDGTALAFSGYHAGYVLYWRGPPLPTDSHPDVYVARLADGATRRVTGHPDEPAPVGARGGSNPSWWPDGDRLFVTTGEPSVVNADGSCSRPFRPVTGAAHIAWRPGSRPAFPPLRCADLWARFSTLDTVVARGGTYEIGLTMTNVGNEPAASRVVVDSLRNAAVTAWSAPGAVCGRATTCELGLVEPGERVAIGVTLRAGAPGQLAVSVAAVTAGDPTPENNGLTFGVAVSTCRLVGTPGADELVGTTRADSICGLTGPDRIEGRAGNDVLDGGNGTDTILGGAGRDRIEGRGGRDVIVARDGARDAIACGSERDTVVADRKDAVARDCERVLRR